MTTRRRRRIALSTLAATALVVSACGSDDDTAGAPSSDSTASSSITLYSGRSEELVQPIIDQFESATGIDVNVKYDDSANLALLIEEEATAGRVEADLFLAQSPGTLGFLAANDRLATLPDSTLDLVDEQLRDNDGRWIGISGRQRVLVYNTDLVDPADLPDSVFGLIDERWSNQIGIAGGNGSFQDFVTALRAIDGEESTEQWLSDLAALDPVQYPKNSAIVAAVGRGEIEIGLVNHYYNFRALAEDPDLPTANHQFASGDAGSTLLVSAAGVLDGADGTDAAIEFIEYLLSEEGQSFFTAEDFEYPAVPGQDPVIDLPPIDFGNVGGVDFEQLDGGLERTRELIADAGLES